MKDTLDTETFCVYFAFRVMQRTSISTNIKVCNVEACNIFIWVVIVFSKMHAFMTEY